MKLIFVKQKKLRAAVWRVDQNFFNINFEIACRYLNGNVE